MEKLRESSPTVGRYLQSKSSSGRTSSTDNTVIFTDFTKLPMVQRVYALQVAVAMIQKTPVIGSYANEIFGKFRKIIRLFEFKLDGMSEAGRELYFHIRCGLLRSIKIVLIRRKSSTFSELSLAIGRLQETKWNVRDLERTILAQLGEFPGKDSSPPSPRKKVPAEEQNRILELLEDVWEKCFEECPWNNALQDEAGNLKQSAEFSQLINYMDQVLHIARFIPIPKIATTTFSLLYSLAYGGNEVIGTGSIQKLLGNATEI